MRLPGLREINKLPNVPEPVTAKIKTLMQVF